MFELVRLKQGLCAIVVMLLLTTVTSQAALPPEYEQERLLRAAGKALAAENWQEAEVQLERVTALQLELPPDYYFLAGKVALNQSRPGEAVRLLEQYIVATGKDSEHYLEALDLITSAENTLQSEAAANIQQSAEPPTLALEMPAEDARDFLGQLKQLYLTDDDTAALASHINSLFARHQYVGSRVVNRNERQGILYNLGVDKSGYLVIRETDYREEKGPQIKVKRFAVFGVDPFIQYRCDYDRFQCWLYNPTDRLDRWIVLDRDQKAAEEVARSLSLLIRTMQSP